MNKRLNWIDFLRGLAALGVVAAHSTTLLKFDDESFLMHFFSLGKYGPQLFYALSAMTLFLSLDGCRNEKNWLANFYIKRVIRIAPLFYFAILIYTFFKVDPLNSFNSDITKSSYAPFSFLANIFFLHSLSPNWINDIVPGSWSIGIEFFFYFFTPYLFLKITTLRRSLVLFLLFSVIQRYFFPLLNNHVSESANPRWISFSYTYLGSNLPYFGMGIILYFSLFKKVRFSVADLTILTTSLVFFSSPKLSLAFYVAAFIITCKYLTQNCHAKIIRPILFLGEISYSLYLMNFISIRFLDYLNKNFIDFNFNFFTAFIASVVMTSFISTLTYYLVEKNGLKFGKKLLIRR